MPITPLHVRSADGYGDVVVARPRDGGSHPAVLMYPDGFGIRPTLIDIADELAANGYYVLVPNVFYRHRPSPVVDLPAYIDADTRPAVMSQVMPLIHEHTADRVVRDARAYLEFLSEQPDVTPGPIAVTGYCIGGLYATQTAINLPDQVTALAAFHAPVAAAGADALGALTCRAHFGHAASDLSEDDLEALNTVLDASGADYTSEIYPDSVHGFTMRDTDSFNAEGMHRHWTRLLDLLSS